MTKLEINKFYIEGIKVRRDWTRAQWEELARLLRGTLGSAGFGEDHDYWIDFPVMKGREAVTLTVYTGSIVVFTHDGVKLFGSALFAEESQ